MRFNYRCNLGERMCELVIYPRSIMFLVDPLTTPSWDKVGFISKESMKELITILLDNHSNAVKFNY